VTNGDAVPRAGRELARPLRYERVRNRARSCRICLEEQQLLATADDPRRSRASARISAPAAVRRPAKRPEAPRTGRRAPPAAHAGRPVGWGPRRPRTSTVLMLPTLLPTRRGDGARGGGRHSPRRRGGPARDRRRAPTAVRGSSVAPSWGTHEVLRALTPHIGAATILRCAAAHSSSTDMTVPLVFIGSSSEGEDYAHGVKAVLEETQETLARHWRDVITALRVRRWRSHPNSCAASSEDGRPTFTVTGTVRSSSGLKSYSSSARTERSARQCDSRPSRPERARVLSRDAVEGPRSSVH
jgi:hypothetical protein